MKGYETIARLLIKNGFNVNLQNARNSSALQTAAHKGYENIVHILLENGADPNLANLHGSTALHAAVNNGLFVHTNFIVLNYIFCSFFTLLCFADFNCHFLIT